MVYQCLVIKKDLTSIQTTHKSLKSFGLKPITVTSVESAVQLIGRECFDVVLLDTRGFDIPVVRMLDDLHITDVPIVLLSIDADEESKIRLMVRGATAVLPASASLRFVGVRLRRLAQVRGERSSRMPTTLRVGSLTLDTQRVSAQINCVDLDLSVTQFEVLLLLASQVGEFVSRESIGTTIRSKVRSMGSRSVDMLIGRIRQKLRSFNEVGLVIDTIYAKGYVLRYVGT